MARKDTLKKIIDLLIEYKNKYNVIDTNLFQFLEKNGISQKTFNKHCEYKIVENKILIKCLKTF